MSEDKTNKQLMLSMLRVVIEELPDEAKRQTHQAANYLRSWLNFEDPIIKGGRRLAVILLASELCAEVGR